MKYTGLSEQVTRTAVRLFCFSFLCLTSGFYPRGTEASYVRCQPWFRTGDMGTRADNRPACAHTKSWLCPYKRCFPRKWRIRKALWLFFKLKPKSNHLEKKFKIHYKVLRRRGRLCLWTGLIPLCNPSTNNPISQFSGLFHYRHLKSCCCASGF